MDLTLLAPYGIQTLLALPWVLTAFAIFYYVVVVFVALAVKKDADRRLDTKEGLFLIAPWLWMLVVLVAGGFLPALAYWVIHYSSLRYRRDEARLQH